MLKQQLDQVSQTHDLEALDREREKLINETRAVTQRTQDMETEIQALKQELHTWENKELDMINKDNYRYK